MYIHPPQAWGQSPLYWPHKLIQYRQLAHRNYDRNRSPVTQLVAALVLAAARTTITSEGVPRGAGISIRTHVIGAVTSASIFSRVIYVVDLASAAFMGSITCPIVTLRVLSATVE